MKENNPGKIGLLLINLGTPDSCQVRDVRVYLREFLMDRRVIDIPFLRRFFLVNFLIAPFRAPQSAKGYQELWTGKGSPLKVYGDEIRALLETALGNEYFVDIAMRYQNPSIQAVLGKFENRGFKKIIILPLYPQYSSAATGSSIEEAIRIISRWEVIPELKIISQFFDHPLFIQAFTEMGRSYIEKGPYDHILFSYHGLPESQIHRASSGYCRINEQCCSVYHAQNQFCYRAQCFQTTRLLAKTLNLDASRYTVCFQSRLGSTPWIKPYTDQIITDLAKKGARNLLVFSPAFIADCLETTFEIGVEYKKLFREKGGGVLDLVPSLNVHPLWVECLKEIVLNGMSRSPLGAAQLHQPQNSGKS